VFLVDAADRSRFEEARIELQQLQESHNLASVPIVVLGNKIDKPSAASEEELRSQLNMPTYVTSGYDKNTGGNPQSRPQEIFMCSIMRRMGYAEAFKWLAQYLD